ncbi:MAG: SIS domain-containing protein [Candidatus Lokiarchaeota archaeon]|nr:SIS domain-containing protein [Candidatus Lokiarchaeota archaeon]
MADKVNNEYRLNGKERQILFQSMDVILQNLQENMEHLGKTKHFEHTQKFIDLVYDGLRKKRKFFLLASGRSAFILQCFATRLVHLGADVFMVTNLGSIPALSNDDILIVLSGSGTTSIVVSLLKNYVNTAKPFGIVSITSHPETIIGRVGDITIRLKGRSKRDKVDLHDDTAILTPEGTMFEIAAFVYLDAIIAELAIKMGKTNADMLRKHSETI